MRKALLFIIILFLFLLFFTGCEQQGTQSYGFYRDQSINCTQDCKALYVERACGEWEANWTKEFYFNKTIYRSGNETINVTWENSSIEFCNCEVWNCLLSAYSGGLTKPES